MTRPGIQISRQTFSPAGGSHAPSGEPRNLRPHACNRQSFDLAPQGPASQLPSPLLPKSATFPRARRKLTGEGRSGGTHDVVRGRVTGHLLRTCPSDRPLGPPLCTLPAVLSLASGGRLTRRRIRRTRPGLVSSDVTGSRPHPHRRSARANLQPDPHLAPLRPAHDRPYILRA